MTFSAPALRAFRNDDSDDSISNLIGPPVRLFEIVLPAPDVNMSMEFYVEVMGCEPAFEAVDRGMTFLWLPRRSGLIVLDGSGRYAEPLHLAFLVESEHDVLTIRNRLESRDQRFTSTAFHEWMSGHSFYFPDPGGNELELFMPDVRSIRDSEARSVR